jgi:LCP family protein required for cell wall assembly
MPTSLSGSERERVNVLVVGYSADDPGHEGANLTDSILLLSMSTNGKNSYMLNIPRDLYVTIPDSGRAKINEAYQRGESESFSEPGLPAGGIGLLEKTVSESLGVTIDYYALVNYAAVRSTADAVGGITVNIQSSDPRGIYDPNFQPHEGGPLKLANGPQKIDGQTALRLTRARGAAGGYGFALSDFDRSKNQQEVFRAIKESMTTKLLLNPQKNGKVLDAVATNVRTDVEISEVLPLYRLFKGIPSAELDTISLRDINKQNLIKGYTTPSGQSALIPSAGRNDFSDIQSAIDELNQ